MAEEVTAGGDAADPLANPDACIHILIRRTGNILRANYLLDGWVTLPNAEVTTISSKGKRKEKKAQKWSPHDCGADSVQYIWIAGFVFMNISLSLWPH